MCRENRPLYVVSGFSRTVMGPPEGGHYVQMKIALAERVALA